MEYSFFLRQRRICITDATGDFAKSVIEHFSKHKCKFFLVDSDKDKLEKLANYVDEELGTEADICVADLTNLNDLKNVLKDMTAVGGIDILIYPPVVNNFIIPGANAEALYEAIQKYYSGYLTMAYHLMKDAFSYGHGWGRIFSFTAKNEQIDDILGKQAYTALEHINAQWQREKANSEIGIYRLNYKKDNDIESLCSEIKNLIKEQ